MAGEIVRNGFSDYNFDAVFNTVNPPPMRLTSLIAAGFRVSTQESTWTSSTTSSLRLSVA